ncbi:YggT family protein [Lactiplantibacillus garii]|uniref:YggT family protein n=1 Tax=Lactiplantibacillus garii TaxID=2306423 RepID=A0A3R8J952_9LACO|nr:YggT family protein [Lactiplantibacillus garii]RRK11629.1 YggT family protein [Lactiplantibacillus garii]
MLINIISRLFQLYQLAIVVFILMSWFPGAYNTGIGRFLGRICEPFLSIFRRFIPAIAGLDFSPIIALLVLQLAETGLFYLLQMLGLY